MFLRERGYEIFKIITYKKIPINQTPLELALKHPPQYVLLSQGEEKHATKYLNKLRV